MRRSAAPPFAVYQGLIKAADGVGKTADIVNSLKKAGVEELDGFLGEVIDQLLAINEALETKAKDYQ